MKFRTLLWRRAVGGVELISCRRKTAGVVLRAPSAALAQMLSMVVSCSTKNFGGSVGSQAMSP